MKMVIHAAACLLAATALLAAADEKADKPEAKDVKIEDITLKIPADWKQEKPDNNLRMAQFELPAAEGDPGSEMYVSFFRGDGGGVGPNVNRWVAQFDADGREVKVVQGKCTQGLYVLVDINGTFNMPVGPPIQRQTQKVENGRLMGVILKIEGKGNYFLKMTGTQKSLKGQGEAFRGSFGADAESEKPLEL